MEHRFRLDAGEHAFERGGVAAVAEDRVDDEIGKLDAQFLLHPVQVVFGQFEHGQAFDAEPCDLPAQLRADGPAAAGDQHAPRGQPGTNRRPVERHRFAPEQILDRDFLQFIEVRTALDHVFESRHRAERQAGLFADADDALHLLVLRGRDGDQHHFGGDFARQLRQLLDRPEHRHAVHVGAAQAGLVVEEPDHAIRAFAAQVARQRLAGPPCPEHQHALGRRAAAVVAAVLPVAIGHARRAEQQHQRDRIHQQHRTRGAFEPVEEEQAEGDGERAEDRGTGDVPQVRQAGEAPEAAVQAGPGATAHVTQEDPRRRQVERQEPEAGARQRGTQDLPASTEQAGQCGGAQQRLACGQAIDAIHEVPGIDQHRHQHQRGQHRRQARVLQVQPPRQCHAGQGVCAEAKRDRQRAMIVAPPHPGNQ
jgi:hypothetical protein